MTSLFSVFAGGHSSFTSICHITLQPIKYLFWRQGSIEILFALVKVGPRISFSPDLSVFFLLLLPNRTSLRGSEPRSTDGAPAPGKPAQGRGAEVAAVGPCTERPGRAPLRYDVWQACAPGNKSLASRPVASPRRGGATTTGRRGLNSTSTAEVWPLRALPRRAERRRSGGQLLQSGLVCAVERRSVDARQRVGASARARESRP
ncbi:unnamed protein product [Urochloa humidicola]